MKSLLPFILPFAFMMWIVTGAWQLTYARRTLERKDAQAKEASPEGEGAPASTDEKKENKPLPDFDTRLRKLRLGGLAWCAVGLIGVLSIGLRIGITSDTAVWNAKGNDPELQSFVSERAREYRRENAIVGFSIAAVADEKTAVVGVGQVSVSDSTQPDGESVYEIGSISKSFTGILLADAIERGEVDLDQSVQSLLPESAPMPENVRDRITLRHLTTHSSGFPHMPSNFLTAMTAAKMLFGGDPHPDYTEAQFLDAVRNVDLDFEPGTKSSYSNFGTSLLGFLLAERAGVSYDQLMQSRICRPLGMADTTVSLNDGLQKRLAPGHRSSLRFGPLQIALDSANWDLPNHFAGAGGIRSTANDMLTFLKANMGAIDSPLNQPMRESHKELLKDEESLAMAMNWIRMERGDKRPAIIWHNGGTGGYRSFMGFTEDGRFGVVVLANTAKSMDQLGRDLLVELEQAH